MIFFLNQTKILVCLSIHQDSSGSSHHVPSTRLPLQCSLNDTQCPDHNACSSECVSSKKCLSCIWGLCHSMACAQKRLLHLLPLPSNFLTQRQWTASYSSQHLGTQKGLEEKGAMFLPLIIPLFLSLFHSYTFHASASLHLPHNLSVSADIQVL